MQTVKAGLEKQEFYVMAIVDVLHRPISKKIQHIVERPTITIDKGRLRRIIVSL